MIKLILYQKFLNKKRRKTALCNNTLDEELFQNHLTEELTNENSNIVINLTATLDVLEKCQILQRNRKIIFRICRDFSK